MEQSGARSGIGRGEGFCVGSGNGRTDETCNLFRRRHMTEHMGVEFRGITGALQDAERLVTAGDDIKRCRRYAEVSDGLADPDEFAGDGVCF
ncbi:hypothetical protein M1555_03825 [Patescibacteria group bacterium]|nr:hypothetical protein [Patescibacteria group bacterium]